MQQELEDLLNCGSIVQPVPIVNVPKSKLEAKPNLQMAERVAALTWSLGLQKPAGGNQGLVPRIQALETLLFGAHGTGKCTDRLVALEDCI